MRTSDYTTPVACMTTRGLIDFLREHSRLGGVSTATMHPSFLSADRRREFCAYATGVMPENGHAVPVLPMLEMLVCRVAPYDSDLSLLTSRNETLRHEQVAAMPDKLRRILHSFNMGEYADAWSAESLERQGGIVCALLDGKLMLSPLYVGGPGSPPGRCQVAHNARGVTLYGTTYEAAARALCSGLPLSIDPTD